MLNTLIIFLMMYNYEIDYIYDSTTDNFTCLIRISENAFIFISYICLIDSILDK